MPYRKRIITVVLVALLCLILDHATKWWAVSALQGVPGQPWRYLGDLFRIQYAENTGAFLGLGGNMSSAMRTIMLVGVNGVILAIVATVLILRHPLNAPTVWGLALILSGGIGNMIDRVFRGGIVVDFMNMGIPWGPFQVRTGIFNVADVAIMAGLGLLLAKELFMGKKPADSGSGATDTPDRQ